MPRVAFGSHPGGMDGVPADHPGVIVMHHYMGTWKAKGMKMLTPATVGSLVTRVWRFVLLRHVLGLTPGPARASASALCCVSDAWWPQVAAGAVPCSAAQLALLVGSWR